MNKNIDEKQNYIIASNIKKIAKQYQELLLHIMHGKCSIVPNSLLEIDKMTVMCVHMYQQFLEHPEKFLETNKHYSQKLQQLVSNSIEKFLGNNRNSLFVPHAKDKRFADPAWQDSIYFDFIKQFYLMSAEWIQDNIKHYEFEPELANYVQFLTKQFIDALSPSNFIFYNPQVLRESIDTCWQNIVQGLDNLLNDIKKSNDILEIPTVDKSVFKLGKNIAATEGKVVMQNQLMQLICYNPKVKTHLLPLLIIPPCINKYYILDLSPQNSLISFLIKNNFQVFVLSWKNPDKDLAQKNFEDYLQEGVIDACEYIAKLGYSKINAAGYCIGGTILATAIAYMRAHNIDYINSATFLTTMLDFSDPGALGVFINEASIKNIENEMKDKGYFDGKYLSNSFSLMRANDLIWSFVINNYLLGKTPSTLDILYWNSDYVNLPAKMYSYYLRNMYLNNLLSIPNALNMLETPINLGKIDCDSFFLAAKDDHIAPLKSIYNSAKLLSGKRTFCVTSSGHVAGVINPPSMQKYNHYINTDLTLNTEDLLSKSKQYTGSWWVSWYKWLSKKSGKLTQSMDYNDIDFIEYAPGSYASYSNTNEF